MSDLTLVIPVVGELEKGPSGGGWLRKGERVFYTIRYFLKCRQRDTNTKPKMGKIGLKLGTQTSVKTTTVESFEEELLKKNSKTAMEEFFSSSEELSEASAGLAVDLVKLLPIGVKIDLTAKLSEKLANSFKQSMTFTQEDQTKVTYKISASYEVTAADVNKSFVVPIQYTEIAYDVFLCRVDYLIVAYEADGLFKSGRRKKFPDATDTSSVRAHRNVWTPEPDDRPLCCIKTYQVLNSSALIEEDKHKIEVDYPDAYTSGPPERLDAGAFSVPKDCPTLYHVAEQAFPKKWDKTLVAQE